MSMLKACPTSSRIYHFVEIQFGKFCTKEVGEKLSRESSRSEETERAFIVRQMCWLLMLKENHMKLEFIVFRK